MALPAKAESNAGHEPSLAYLPFLVDLSHLETGLVKHQSIHEMNQRELQHYEIESRKIEEEIEQARNDIESLKGALEIAQIQRQNKLEYDDVARHINRLPSRAASEKNAESLGAEIQALREELRSLDSEYHLRRKQLLTIVTAVHEMQDSIAERRDAAEAAKVASAGNISQLLNSTPPSLPMQPTEEEEEGVVVEDGMEES
ncbi:THO complex subunit 7 [Borealophlyctis nickersoniae]|nr:THO complex subunit 7 [Borealophlyctis nickersoniae]